MSEHRDQSRAAACTTALHGAGRNIEDAGGLGDRITLHVDEDERGALLRRQLGESGQEFAVQILAFGGCLGGLMRFEELIEAIGIVDRGCLPRSGLPHAVEAGVDGDAVQPGGDRGLPSEGVSGAEGGDQGVLDRVRRLFAIAERTQSHGPEPVTMPPYELTEGVRLAGYVPGQEIMIVRVGESGVVQR